MQFFKDLNLSAFTAGFVAVLVGFTSSVAIVFQAAQAFQATPAEVTSWMWALGLGMGLCSAIPSLWLRKPVMVAWSTPGAAVLVATVRSLKMQGGAPKHALDVEDVLHAEWQASQPELAACLGGAETSAQAKGWRWEAEMREIARTFAGVGLSPGFGEAAAAVFSGYERPGVGPDGEPGSAS